MTPSTAAREQGTMTAMGIDGPRRSVAIAVGVLSLSGCGGTPSPPPSAPQPPAPQPAPQSPTEEAVDTGKDCVTAQSRCGSGVCNVTIKNGCTAAVRCDLEVSATCDSQSGMTEAAGGEHDTIAASSASDLAARAVCSGGPIIHTEVKKLVCK